MAARDDDAEFALLVAGVSLVTAGVVWALMPKSAGAAALPAHAYAPSNPSHASEDTVSSIPRDMESRVEAPRWATIALSPSVSITVSEDYVKSDGIRLPMTPAAAQRTADRFNAILPTATIVSAIWRAAPVKIEPRSMTPHGTATRGSLALTREHDAIVNSQIAGRPGIVAGAMKDIVVGPAIGRNPGKVIIFGWHRLDGTPIQSSSAAHNLGYFDYSHGTRLVSKTAHVNGVAVPIESVFANPATASLVSAEGPLRPDQLRY